MDLSMVHLIHHLHLYQEGLGMFFFHNYIDNKVRPYFLDQVYLIQILLKILVHQHKNFEKRVFLQYHRKHLNIQAHH